MQVKTTEVLACAVCGSRALAPWAKRADGVAVLRCDECGMGVIEAILDDLSALYADGYYGVGHGQQCRGYTDYEYTAEHSLGWAADLVRLLRPAGGSVLDIGCADGHLLAMLGPGYTLCGIEANETMGAIAVGRGVDLLGRDLLHPDVLGRHKGRFDVITAIAVFEHLRDIRAGVATALELLRPDGVLLFEVPLMSEQHGNQVWLTSSLEHVWYPSERSLHRLVERELGARMEGAEIYVGGYASTYIGLVCRPGADAGVIEQLAARVLRRRADPASSEEAVARMLLHLVHAVTVFPDDLTALARLPTDRLTPPLVRRLAEVLRGEFWNAQRAAGVSGATIRRLRADLAASISDRTLSNTELTTALVALNARLASVRARLDAKVAEELEVWRRQNALDGDRAELEAARVRLSEAERAIEVRSAEVERRSAHVDAVHASFGWKLLARLHRTVARHPKVARLFRRALIALWWTVRGKLPSLLRLRRQLRAARLAAPAPNLGSAVPAPLPARPSGAITSPSRPGARPVGMTELTFHPHTGHRPALPRDSGAESPLVSVVIVSFNYGRFLTDAVDSVLAQTFRDLEVIVVEGGSTDPDSRLVAAQLTRERTRVLMQGEPTPVGANRNFGISQARGRYVCCVDADDMLMPTYIEKAVFLLERHGYDVVSSALRMFGKADNVYGVQEQPDLSSLLEANQVVTTAVFRRCLWERSGGYRELDQRRHGYVYEDWAFWIRLAAIGARIRNLHNDPMLRYRQHGPSLSRDEGKLPMWEQRNFVRQINHDVLKPLPEVLAHSRRRAAVAYGTPTAPPPAIVLDRASPVGPRQPTLLLAMPFLILGGAERLLSSLVGHLVRQGWRVVLTTSIDPALAQGDATPWFEPHTAEIFHLPRFLPAHLWEDFLHHLVRSREIDILWVVGSAVAYDCLRGLRAAHPALRVADLLFNTVGHTANNRRRRAQIDLIFVENTEVQRWLVDRREDPARIRLVESGVDLGALRPRPRCPSLAERIGAAPDDMIVAFSGRWSEEKDPLGFVAAARIVDPSLPIRFIMTGTGPLRSALEEAVRQADFAPGRFTILGEVPDLTPILASSDLLVLPSILDGRPVVVLEALALGVPVLASRVGALPEIIEDGRTGWLRAPGDVGGFAAAIEAACRDRAGLRAMRAEARAYAEARLDAQRMFAEYQAGLVSLLPEQRPGS